MKKNLLDILQYADRWNIRFTWQSAPSVWWLPTSGFSQLSFHSLPSSSVGTPQVTISIGWRNIHRNAFLLLTKFMRLCLAQYRFGSRELSWLRCIIVSSSKYLPYLSSVDISSYDVIFSITERLSDREKHSAALVQTFFSIVYIYRISHIIINQTTVWKFKTLVLVIARNPILLLRSRCKRAIVKLVI